PSEYGRTTSSPRRSTRSCRRSASGTSRSCSTSRSPRGGATTIEIVRDTRYPSIRNRVLHRRRSWSKMLPSWHALIVPRGGPVEGGRGLISRSGHRSKGGSGMRFRRAALGLAIPVVLAAAAVFATAASSSSSSQLKVGQGTASAAKSVCGLGNGKKATGAPIRLGAIATKQPGTDFTDIPNMAKAYFDCVNANGGIYGHRVQYTIQTEQTDPGQLAALAKKLVESTKVVGLVGNTSIIDCSINHKYYEAKGLYVIASGIAPECYGRDTNISSVNM